MGGFPAVNKRGLNMWLILAAVGAVCTSLTTIFAKIGVKNVNSDLATAYRTAIVLVCSLMVCFVSGNIFNIGSLDFACVVYLVLSGIATGLSWLTYYKALSLAPVSKVAPVDKSSFVVSSLLFVVFFFGDTTDNGNVFTIVMLIASNALILIGSLFMAFSSDKKDEKAAESKKWFLYAALSACFAAVVSLLIKLGLKKVPSDVGTFFRTIVVLVFSIGIVLGRKAYDGIDKVKSGSWVFLTLSGLATGGAWLLEYAALSLDGVNPVAVNAVGKFSVILTLVFSAVVLKEKFTYKSIIGLVLLSIGIGAAVWGGL